VLERIASVRTSERRFAEARELYDRALAIREQALGPDHVDVALVAYNRAVLETLAGDHGASERWFERAVAGFSRALGPDSPQLALALDGRGTARQRLGRFAAALVDHEAALAILDRAVAPLDPRQRALAAAHAGNALAERGEWPLAVARARAGLEASHGAAVPDPATEASCREILRAAAEAARAAAKRPP
jgi:tetratricopeptide (TPR) repeat protein